MAERLKDLEITKDEIERIGEALKKKEFRDLLVDYCEEINDPENKKKYEEEITQLEKERGIEVTFINPTPGYVIKSSTDGNKLAFINICSNENVGKPSSKNACQEGSRGLQWSLPHLLSPPREDMSKKGSRCNVYDIIFHPETLYLASRKAEFREMVNKISCEAVESNFSVVLDNTNLKFPKMKYKGISRPVVIRKKRSDSAQKLDPNDGVDKIYSDIYKKMDDNYDSKEFKANKNYVPQKKSEYATPKYIIKHRSDIDMQEFTYDRDSKFNSAIPKELIVEINLPLLKSAADLVLDVSEKSLKIISEKPSKYKLDLTLPYSINEDNGNAKFDVDKRTLVVTLPVKRNCNMLLSDIGRYDSGVDSDNSPLADSPNDKSLPLIEELHVENSVIERSSSVESEGDVFRTSEMSTRFLNPELHYSFPENTCHLFDNILSFTLNVKNVDSGSITKFYNESYKSIHIKFSSISTGYFPVNYAFFINLPTHFIDYENVSIEAWDNNVIVQIPYKPCDKMITSYFIGLSEENSEEKIIEEPSIINSKILESLNDTTDQKSNVEVELDSDDELTITINSNAQEESSRIEIRSEAYELSSMSSRTLSDSSTEDSKLKTNPTEPQNIKNRSPSESSADEGSTSLSPSKKSILKTHCRIPVSRSVSESSADDYTWSSSFENCAANSESLIPEETEALSSSMKKTVRFNDVISKQLFRTNSSILGQRKKNQRKNRNKKRAQERRMSESENSEVEDKKYREKTNSQQEKNGANYLKKEKLEEHTSKQNENIQIDFKSDLIFDLDM